MSTDLQTGHRVDVKQHDGKHAWSPKSAMKNTEHAQRVERAPILWMHEAITYLGLDRLGLARPDLSIHRLIRKGALHPRKIGGRLAFDKSELERLAANGDQKRGRGRPKKFS